MTRVTVVILFVLAFFVVGRNLDKPFWGIHDWNGARYGNLAKNYMKYWDQTGFAQVEYQKPSGEFVFNTHYPPLLPLLIVKSYLIFGVSEWSTRLVPVLFTSWMVVAIFLLGKTLVNYQVGLIASLLTLATPMVRYFGKMPVHEVVVASLVVTAFLGLALWQKRPENKILILVIFVSTALACLTTWSGFFAAAAIGLLLLKNRRLFTNYSLMVILLFLGHFFFVYLITGKLLGGELGEIFLYRSGQTPQEYNLLEFVLRIRTWLSTLFTVSLVGSLVFILPFIKKLKGNLGVLFGIGFFGVGYPLVFHNAAYIHSYFIYSLVPIIVLTSSIGIYYFFQKFLPKLYFPTAILLVFLVFIEKEDYRVALEESDNDKLAVQIGREINSKTDNRDSVAIVPEYLKYSAEKFILFYGGSRRYEFTDDPNLENYDAVVSVDQVSGKIDLLRKNR